MTSIPLREIPEQKKKRSRKAKVAPGLTGGEEQKTVDGGEPGVEEKKQKRKRSLSKKEKERVAKEMAAAQLVALENTVLKDGMVVTDHQIGQDQLMVDDEGVPVPLKNLPTSAANNPEVAPNGEGKVSEK